MIKLFRANTLLFLAFAAFISLGMPDGLHGVAWPGIRAEFGLPVDAIGLLLICNTIGYTCSSFFNAILLRRLGIGVLLAISCAVTGGALLVYSVTPFWPLFVTIALAGGLGAGAIDAGLNTYVARYYSPRIMQWLHAFFGVGITLGPFIMTLVLHLLEDWRPGYLLVGSIQLFLAVLFFATCRKWDSTADRVEEMRGGYKETLTWPPSVLSMFMFFLYTGIELGLGIWSYSFLTESRGISLTIAGFITGFYWAMFTIGRIFAGVYTQVFSVNRVLLISILIAGSGLILVILNAGDLPTVAGIVLTGFAIAPIFPGLVSDTARRVGKRHEAHTIGMQIAAAGLGLAVLPSFAGILARWFTLEVIPVYLLFLVFLLLASFLFSYRYRRTMV